MRLAVASPQQEAYELLRPVLFGRTPAMRAAETSVPERTPRRRPTASTPAGWRASWPAPPRLAIAARAGEIRQAIVDSKAEHPPLGLREIAEICRRRFRRRVGHHTVRRTLANGLALTPQPAASRATVTSPTLSSGAWPSCASIGRAGTSPRLPATWRTTRARLRCPAALGGRGTARPRGPIRAPRDPARKVDLQALAAVRRLQVNPEIGGFRASAALEQQGIELSPAHLPADPDAASRARRSSPGAGQAGAAAAPFAAAYRHHIWSVDIGISSSTNSRPGPSICSRCSTTTAGRSLASLVSPPTGPHRLPGRPPRRLGASRGTGAARQ